MAATDSRSMFETGREPTPIAVGLGSNVGDRAANLRLGVQALAAVLTELKCSGVFETQPVHVVDQPLYLNACCIGRTLLTARQLLEVLHTAERLAGRLPGGQRYGPRPLDLDLVLFGNETILDRDLVVPHPRLRERSFVLTPLAELASDWAVPESEQHRVTTIGELARAIGKEGMVRTDIQLSRA